MGLLPLDSVDTVLCSVVGGAGGVVFLMFSMLVVTRDSRSCDLAFRDLSISAATVEPISSSGLGEGRALVSSH